MPSGTRIAAAATVTRNMAWDAVPPPPVLGAPLGVTACGEGVGVGHPPAAGDGEAAPHPVGPMEGEADVDVPASGEGWSLDWLASGDADSDVD
ncbi:hypothetical protein HC031_10030 [Planosporangium thailandense]|uniref:Uncharacterized protein n=1 Tax=Planosporangium thailandense TaxID=765197 RepID=A0ABX0XXR3_9ACTN|nr:hypothetical protein [Planosporangium thailandense]NJC70044.1 hypothetical protein [Planosporangium thailandense]